MGIITDIENVTYVHFPNSFNSECDCIEYFLSPIFKKVASITKKPVCVVNVFPNTPHGNIHDRSIMWVSYSGEVYHQTYEENLYDLHVIMEKEDLDNKIIYASVFSLYAYEQNAWTRLMYPRHIYR